jgi:CRP/FNR family transcriptional regulator, cyclic AMP receptor protein
MPKSKAVEDPLAGVPLFQGLSKRELQAITSVTEELEHPEGQNIVVEGKSGAGFHLILEGSASVKVGGREVTVLASGDYFGEMSLIDGGPRSATVTATTPVRTLSIASWDFMPLLEKHAGIAAKLLVEMVRRIRRLESSPID